MTQPTADERQVTAEVRAAMAIVLRHRPASMLFRLSSDRDGRVRLVLERIEGIPLAALSSTPLTRG